MPMHKLTLFLLLLSIGIGFSACQTEEKPLYVSYQTFDEIEPIFTRESDTTYVINFWATWCKPCVKELPYFEELYANYGKDKVKVILVSMDFDKDIETRFIPFLEENQLESDVALLLDGKYNDWIGKVDDQWDGVIPVTLIYNKDKRRFYGSQYANYEQLENMVKDFL